MKKIFASIITIVIYGSCFAQHTENIIPADTAALDLKLFASNIIADESENYSKAKTLLSWLSSHFEWKGTDYKRRTVKEIIVRKGGNCFELARVYMALLKELNINYRPIAEINMHKLTPERGETAAQKVKESGNRMSVFGRQHNDHRWVEIYDEKNKEWVPADPTMNIIGYDQWLKGRAWFGERQTLNADISKDMIAPFAIFVASPENTGKMLENRTTIYMVDKLDALYGNQLSKLPSWNKWISGLQRLSEAAKRAFASEENLHNYNEEIAALGEIYESLKQEYLSKKPKG